MFALTFDQRRSRRTGDRVPALLEALRGIPARLPAERTVGDEAQILLEDASAALAATRVALELGDWSIGLGIGPIERPLPASVREARGEVFRASRTALAAARTGGEVPVAVRAADSRREDTARDAQAVLGLVGWMIRTRSAGQQRTVDALRAAPSATQDQLAEQLGVTQQTVSRSLRTSGWREESAAHDLAERLLAMADLTS